MFSGGRNRQHHRNQETKAMKLAEVREKAFGRVGPPLSWRSACWAAIYQRDTHNRQIKAFAEQFDPQPFHTDEKAAERTFFKGLAASGWHTAAITMRLNVESGPPLAGGIVAARLW